MDRAGPTRSAERRRLSRRWCSPFAMCFGRVIVHQGRGPAGPKRHPVSDVPMTNLSEQWQRSDVRAAQGAQAWNVRLLFGFLVACLLAQVTMTFGPPLGLRTILRTLPFLGSLSMLLLVRGSSRRHPAKPWAVAVLLITGLMLLSPTNGGTVAAVAQAGFSAAIVAPLFWTTRIELSSNRLASLFTIWWTFHALSAGIGVLQFYWPETFAFSPSEQLSHFGLDYVASLSFERADGVSVLRPMGLTDLPGGASVSALYVIVGSCYWFLRPGRLLVRFGVLVLTTMATFTLLICQVRSIQIATLGGLLFLAGLLVWRGRGGLARRLVFLLGGIIVVAVGWALAQAGPTVASRLATLTSEPPGELYYRNRGFFLTETVTDFLPNNPLGAGLGRWGMMNQYFADEAGAPAIHAEVQWTGWAIDGGVPLILLYLCLLVVAELSLVREARGSSGEAMILLGVLAALGAALCALTLNAPVMSSQLALEFWMFNGLAVGQAARSDSSDGP